MCAAKKSTLAALLVALWASAAVQAQDVRRGAELYASRCSACHSVDRDRVGPRHAGVFGRKAASVAGYDYSPALARSGVVWSAGTLDSWLRDPEELVPGQKMGFSVGDAKDRADLIAYLATLK